MAVRIAGVILPPEKRIEIALRYIFGIGATLSLKILKEANIDPNTRTKAVSSEEAERLKQIIEKRHKVEGELRREILFNVKRLKEIGAYRGTRHAKRLPVRGQRTKTNSRTVRGNVRKTMGSGKRNASEKT